MLRKVDLNNSKNLFIVSSILVTGIGGLTLEFGFNEMTQGPILTVTSLAVALIFGIITNLIVNNGKLVADSADAGDGSQSKPAPRNNSKKGNHRKK
jgi:uracil permease